MTPEDLMQLVSAIIDGASKSPAPCYVAVSPHTAALITALNDAHERGDTETIERIREETLDLMFP